MDVSEKLKAIGGSALAIVAALLILWATLWALTILDFIASNARDTARCTDLGYINADVTIHYPQFWHGDAYCYGGKATQHGVKL